MLKKIKLLLLSVFLLSLFSGCTSGFYRIYVQSNVTAKKLLQKPDKTKAVIVPGIIDEDPYDAEFKKYSKYIEKALNSSGFEIIEDSDRADIVIVAAYGIGEPVKKEYTYQEPVYGITGVRSSFYSNTYTYQGITYYSGVPVHEPQYGIVGATTRTKTYTIYYRHLILTAYDSPINGNQLWKTEITSAGKTGNLDKVFPVLVAAAKPYLNQDSEGEIEIILRENDKEVVRIKKAVKE